MGSRGMLLLRLSVFLIGALCLSRTIEVSSINEIVSKPLSLVYFYANDCKFCQAFNDDFQYLSQIFNSNENFQVVKVNGREHRDITNVFGVSSFPSLRLYDDVEKKVVKFNEARSIENLQKFISEFARVDPDLTAIQQSIIRVYNLTEVDRLLLAAQPLLIAFVDLHNWGWSTYHYPEHFYQKLARKHQDITFAIKSTDDTDSELLQRYHVSNFPSLVYLNGDQIGIFNTLSTNQMTNYKVEDRQIEEFLADCKAERGGVIFNGVGSLHDYAEKLEFEGHMQRKAGMNYVESRLSSESELLSLDQQYELLLAKVEL